MTVTKTIGAYHDASNARIRKIGVLTGPTSYATGGDSLTALMLGMGSVDLILTNPFTNGSVVILAVWVRASSLMKFFDMAGVEIANGTNLSTYTASFEAIGH